MDQKNYIYNWGNAPLSNFKSALLSKGILGRSMYFAVYLMKVFGIKTCAGVHPAKYAMNSSELNSPLNDEALYLLSIGYSKAGEITFQKDDCVMRSLFFFKGCTGVQIHITSGLKPLFIIESFFKSGKSSSKTSNITKFMACFNCFEYVFTDNPLQIEIEKRLKDIDPESVYVNIASKQEYIELLENESIKNLNHLLNTGFIQASPTPAAPSI